MLEADRAIRLGEQGVILADADIGAGMELGAALADEALKRRPDLRVLYTTGFTRNAVVHNGVLDPGVNFLPKPFTLQQLGAKLREVLNR